MKKILLTLTILCSLLCFSQDKATQNTNAINLVLDNWHQAASNAQFEAYFNALDKESVFIGTDATENWNKAEFMTYAKPYFDKGKAWSFTPLQRNIYFSSDFKTAWFDELLDTQMKICRGSGVLVNVKGNWKIKQYVLSATIPNEKMGSVIKIKAPIEDALMETMKNNKLVIVNRFF